MKNYTIRIKGLKTADGKIRLTDLIGYLENLQKSAQSALRINSEGYSKKRGTLPKWIEDATDFIVSPQPSQGSTCLHFEAPLLNEVADEKSNKQPNLFDDNIVSSSDTALTVLQKTFDAVEREDLNSDFLDKNLLDTLSNFKRDSETFEILDGDSTNSPLLFGYSLATFEKIVRIRQDAPSPQEATVVGMLNIIAAKKGVFNLDVDNATLRGRINPEFMSVEDLRDFWNKLVLVKGTLHYKASGNPQIMDAKNIILAEKSDDIFGKIPSQQIFADFMRDVPVNYKRISLDDIFGKLETDESEEELFQALAHHG